jgi:hypothetical protein
MRIVGEDPGLATDPFFVFITAAAAALCGWSLYVLRRLRERPA